MDASQNTGYGPASLLVGTPDSYTPWVGNTSEDQKINWYGFYAQDQWRVRKNLVLSFGIRYDYISPPTFQQNQLRPGRAYRNLPCHRSRFASLPQGCRTQQLLLYADKRMAASCRVRLPASQ